MIKITKAAESDAKTLSELGRITFLETFGNSNAESDMKLYLAETFSEEKQLQEIRDVRRFIEMAWIGDQAAGYLHLFNGTMDPSVRGQRPIEILRIYSESHWHGKGVGKALMDRCIQIAAENGFKSLWLGVWEKNLRAQAFYRKYGFKHVGQHIFRLGTDDQIDLIMTRSIEL